MQKLLNFFSAKILAYMPYLMIKVLTYDTLTNDIGSFEQLDPGEYNILIWICLRYISVIVAGRWLFDLELNGPVNTIKVMSRG